MLHVNVKQKKTIFSVNKIRAVKLAVKGQLADAD